MREESYLTEPDRIDMAGADRTIRVSGTIAFGIALAVFVSAYLLLPRFWSFPEDLPARLAFGAQAAVFVLVWVLAGMLMVSSTRRYSPEDIGGSAARPPSPKLAIKVAFLQNTLEQAVMAAAVFLAFASLLGGPWLALIVASVGLFGAGRVLFLRGYARGVRGRALGMHLTALPAILGFPVVILLVIWRLF